MRFIVERMPCFFCIVVYEIWFIKYGIRKILSLLKGGNIKIPPENRRDHLYGRVSKYREINFPTQYYK
jgi:hypothetical protein